MALHTNTTYVHRCWMNGGGESYYCTCANVGKMVGMYINFIARSLTIGVIRYRRRDSY